MKIRGKSLDITDDNEGCIYLSSADRFKIQIEMIRDHCYLLGIDLGKPVSMREACEHWVEAKYAEMFAKHYKLKE